MVTDWAANHVDLPFGEKVAEPLGAFVGVVVC
jgi:hypothetical protein